MYGDVTLTAGAATNPFLESGSTPVAASATVSVTPVYTIDSPLTKLRLIGNVQVTGYSSRYRTSDSYSIRGTGEHRLSEAVLLNGQVSYLNSIVGSYNDVVQPFVGVVDPTSITGGDQLNQLPVFLDDPALAGIGRRRSSYQALGGLSVALSPFDQVSARVAGGATRYASSTRNLDATGLDEFNTASAGLSYSRALSANWNTAANVDVSHVDYLRSRLGDSTIYSPGVSVTHRVQNWSLTASAGVAIVRLQELADTRNSTNVNGSIGACRRETRYTACLTASRATVPSSVQGVRTQTGITGSGSYRVTESDNLSVTATYSRADAPLLRSIASTQRIGDVQFVSGSVSYNRRFAPRLSAFVSAGVSTSLQDDLNRDPNIEGRFGVSYRFGDSR